MRVVQKHGGESIELLLTDVVMPRMSGPELAEKLHASYPGIKVLFTSEYIGDSVSQLDNFPSTGFLAKPYLPDALAIKVRGSIGSIGGCPVWSSTTGTHRRTSLTGTPPRYNGDRVSS